MGIEATRWDATDRLGSTEATIAYLEAVLEDGDPALLAAALHDVSRACGLGGAATNIFSKSGL